MGPWILSQEHSKKVSSLTCCSCAASPLRLFTPYYAHHALLLFRQLRTLSTLSNLSSMRRLSTKSASLFRDLSVRDFSGEGDDQDHPNIDDADQTVRIDIAKVRPQVGILPSWNGSKKC